MRGGKWTLKNGKWVKNNSMKLSAKQAMLKIKKVPSLMRFTRKSGSVPPVRRSMVQQLASPEMNTPTPEEVAERLGTDRSDLSSPNLLKATRHSAPKRTPASLKANSAAWAKFLTPGNLQKRKENQAKNLDIQRRHPKLRNL